MALVSNQDPQTAVQLPGERVLCVFRVLSSKASARLTRDTDPSLLIVACRSTF